MSFFVSIGGESARLVVAGEPRRAKPRAGLDWEQRVFALNA